MRKTIDLRSDTVTTPTDEMRTAMAKARVGDDVLQEDPETNLLEEEAAEIMGKEAALLVPSGTFANQLALFTHCSRGDEVVLSDGSHIVQHEAGAASIIASVQLRTITPRGPYPVWEEVSTKLRRVKDVHFPHTGCIALENALSNGEVHPLDSLEEIHREAIKLNIPVHLDGARIFNASLALGVDVRKIAQATDSLMFCLSKGLSAPIGSLLVGSGDFIEEARKNRKKMGGGMRQSGIIAAPGRIALRDGPGRLSVDHENAKSLGSAFNQYEVFKVAMEEIKINMVFLTLDEALPPGAQEMFLTALEERGIRTYPPEDGWFRFVTHREVTAEDIMYIKTCLPEIVKALDS
jgi:threonine aldolase